MTSQEVVDYINMRFKQGGCDLRGLCYELFQLILSPDLDNDGIKCDNMSCIIIKLASKDSLLYGTPSESHSSGSIA
ncbi:hypothetical protein JTE90_012604 [Oedothorax gibbosus]|uniref:Uncharacterized protein n=1 Tax=Oedothorax gibbosus TaxID=931172 RepID=A0AAV6TPI3_9ARAC|nr:hypothetical protein JTE90_012604 [Oedothorax gibbosus]